MTIRVLLILIWGRKVTKFQGYGFCRFGIFTLYNVCSVLGGGLSTVGMFSTMGDIMSTVRGFLEYRGGYHDKCGDILSIVGMFSTVRDIIFCNLSTVGGSHDTCEGYYEYCEWCSVPRNKV